MAAWLAVPLVWSPRRLKFATSGFLALFMDLDHVIAELVLARGFINHRRTNGGPVCVHAPAGHP